MSVKIIAEKKAKFWFCHIIVCYKMKNCCCRFLEKPSKIPFSLLLSTRNRSYFVYPCPCGFYGDTQKPCTCAPVVVTKYQKRISGPLLDRGDIHIEVLRVDYEKLSGDRMGETSVSIRARVQAARNIQLTLFANTESSNIVASADMRVGEIRQFCKLQDEGQSLMRVLTEFPIRLSM